MRRTRVGIAVGAVMFALTACSTENTNSEGPDASAPTESAPSSRVMTSTPSTPDGVHTAENPFTGDESWIAYQGGDSQGNIRLGLVHPDGTGDRLIDTGQPGDNTGPDWSPDGTRVAVTAHDALYEYDMTTGTTRQLLACRRPCLGNANLAYAPDGEHIAFIRYVGPLLNDVPSDCGIWIGDLKSGRVRQVTSHTNPPCDPYENSIDWSPDGKRLVYFREVQLASGKVKSAIYSIAVDGTDERRLTPPGLVAGEPEYSPDGRWIVFNTHPPDLGEGDSQLYRMRPDGSGIEQLTHYEDVRAFSPTYSPDGNWIIFSVFGFTLPGNAHGLWVIPANGGDPVVIPDVPGTQGNWQPTP